MVALRRMVGAGLAPFGLFALISVLGTKSVGDQALTALSAPQGSVPARAREPRRTIAFAPLNATVFSMPRPIGTEMPDPPMLTLARYEPEISDFSPVTPEPAPRPRSVENAPVVFPTVNRAMKGDRLDRRPAEPAAEQHQGSGLQPTSPAGAADQQTAEPAADTSGFDLTMQFLQPDPPIETVTADELEAAVRYQPFPEYDLSLSLELNPRLPQVATESAPADDNGPTETIDTLATFGSARLYFDGAPIGAKSLAIEPWAAGEAPIIETPAVVAVTTPPEIASPAPAASKPARETVVASRSEPAAEPSRSIRPADLLKLDGKSRAKAERCLANAVYFESRGESVRGQIAVAQVVLNRAFSGYYPHDVCGVVYQGAHRHLSCQFTFACDGIPDVVTEPEAWERAKRVAKATLDGKVWLNEVGKATHYHAYWVNPYWVRSMRRLHKIGVHSFYRPRRWGTGADARPGAARPRWRSPPSSDRGEGRATRGCHARRPPREASKSRPSKWRPLERVLWRQNRPPVQAPRHTGRELFRSQTLFRPRHTQALCRGLGDEVPRPAPCPSRAPPSCEAGGRRWWSFCADAISWITFGRVSIGAVRGTHVAVVRPGGGCARARVCGGDPNAGASASLRGRDRGSLRRRAGDHRQRASSYAPGSL